MGVNYFAMSTNCLAILVVLEEDMLSALGEDDLRSDLGTRWSVEGARELEGDLGEAMQDAPTARTVSNQTQGGGGVTGVDVEVVLVHSAADGSVVVQDVRCGVRAAHRDARGQR